MFGFRWNGAQRLVDEADGTVADCSADEDPGGAVGDLLLDESELRDGFAEGFAVAGIADAVVERHARAADGCIA